MSLACCLMVVVLIDVTWKEYYFVTGMLFDGGSIDRCYIVGKCLCH